MLNIRILFSIRNWVYFDPILVVVNIQKILFPTALTFVKNING